jgi:ABC-type branched-subunit amino acid transport system substrate-binding protein
MTGRERGASAGRGFRSATGALLALALVSGCEEQAQDDTIRIGVILSYTGYLAASSINSERALLAIEAANEAGGVGKKKLRMLTRDTRSNPTKAIESTRQLIEADPAIIIGPDTTDLITQVGPMLQERTMILPSLNTSSDVRWKSNYWFVMGPSLGRVACELVAQIRKDGRTRPLVVGNPSGYNSELAWDLGNRYGMSKTVLAGSGPADPGLLGQLLSGDADAFVLAAFPSSASNLVYALAAINGLPDATRWYLSPVLHTPAFLDSIPRGLLVGARGVSPGTVAGAGDFRVAFQARWQDTPLDDAFPFYDAGAVAILALQRALAREGAIPTGPALAPHVIAVTRSGGMAVRWNELGQGLQRLRDGQEVEYFGLSGQLQFDVNGKTRSASTTWWNIADGSFESVPQQSECSTVD